MKKGQRLWTRDELLLGINLYSKLRFGQIHKGNLDIKVLANIIGRTPDAVALKLVNFASIDPRLKERGIKGMRNVGSLTEKIFQSFYNDWDDYFLESEELLAAKNNTTIEGHLGLNPDEIPKKGIEKESFIKVRVNQYYFRKLLNANYDNKCCITGIDNENLLVASHIVPWSVDEKNRLNPANGLLLNSLHDKAFEHGLLTITENFQIKISSILLKSKVDSIKQNFRDYNNKQITLPKKYKPEIEFLKLHNERFKP